MGSPVQVFSVMIHSLKLDEISAHMVLTVAIYRLLRSQYVYDFTYQSDRCDNMTTKSNKADQNETETNEAQPENNREREDQELVAAAMAELVNIGFATLINHLTFIAYLAAYHEPTMI